MTKTDLLERVERIGGFERDGDAERAIEATLEALGAVLVPSERRTVSEHLPSSLRGVLETPAHLPDLGGEAFFARMQWREAVAAGRAREHVQIVCRALSELLPSEVIALLQRHLPQLAFLFELPGTALEPGSPERIRGGTHPSSRGGNTLATGRPGSQHPLSDARPDRAHVHSVARSDNPHGDTKLSSSRGFTQERENETLAAGRPGPKRTLSG